MTYAPIAMPFTTRRLPDGATLAVSESGDHVFLSNVELELLRQSPEALPLERQADLKARFFLKSQTAGHGSRRLLVSRQAAKRETANTWPALHILVPTLQCAHSCRYCQVSRSLDDVGHTMSLSDLDAASDSIFDSHASTLTVEYQGGDPLIRFDLVKRSIERITERNASEQRRIRFVVASTLHQLTDEMCDFFKSHSVFLSTSVDGPADLHNRNRPTASRDAYQRTVQGIEVARARLGPNSVSALMTTTRESLGRPEDIIDEYVRLGFHEVFLRPLSGYGFAKRNQALMAYRLADFQQFYSRALDRVFHWNQQGFAIREAYASIILNKILSTFDAGYVDLQSPNGAGRSVLVYNYDGFVYPSDEARMLAETGDESLRLGRIGEPLDELVASPAQQTLEVASFAGHSTACSSCPYRLFCAPNPVDALAQFGSVEAPVEATEHCQRHMWLFDKFYSMVRTAEPWMLDLFYSWAAPATEERS